MPQGKNGRKFPAYASAAIADYAKLVGEVTWASNALQNTLSRIFTQLIEPGSHTVGLAIWNSVKTDSAQRDMVKAAAQGRAALHQLGSKGLKNRIIWLCDETSRISAFRNDAVHTPMNLMLTAKKKWRPSPSPAGHDARVRRLDHERYKRLFTLLRGDFIELNHYAAALYQQLAALNFGRPLEPLPRRPRAQSSAFLARALPPKPPPKGHKKARKLQRKPSPK